MSYDPHQYDGPIRRADGVRPYNRYLWPTQSWHANKLDHRVSGRFQFGIVQLADGRFSAEGHVSYIERNQDSAGRPCVFNNRQACLRVAAAHFIRMARWAREWRWPDRLSHSQAEAVINWTRQIVDENAEPITLYQPPEPFKPSGLELFDEAEVKV